MSIRKKFYNFILILLSILITFVFIELFLYLEDYSPNYKTYEVKLINEVKKLNSNPEDLKSKKNATIFLGDSFTQGKVCAGKKKIS